MRHYNLSNADVIKAFNQKLAAERFTTAENIKVALEDNFDYLTNQRRKVRRFPVLPFRLTNAHTPRYHRNEVEAWIIDVLILLIQQGKVEGVERDD